MFWPSRDKSASSEEVALYSPRLCLRPARFSDYDQWVEVRARNRDYLKPFEPAWPKASLEPDFFRRRIERLMHDWNADRTYAFVILDRSTNALIGGLNVNNVTRGAAQYATLGYWLDEARQGNGYMTEAGHVVLGFAFKALELARLNAATLPHNLKSQAMLKRLGFSEEGFARTYIQIEGRRQDHVLFGLNAEEYSGPARNT